MKTKVLHKTNFSRGNQVFTHGVQENAYQSTLETLQKNRLQSYNSTCMNTIKSKRIRKLLEQTKK